MQPKSLKLYLTEAYLEHLIYLLSSLKRWDHRPVVSFVFILAGKDK